MKNTKNSLFCRLFCILLLGLSSAFSFAQEKAYSAYLFAYFKGEGLAQGEQIYFAVSRDGLHWTDLNDGNPVLTSSLGEKGLRDPFIMRSADGKKFFVIATDLKINGNGNWSAAQTTGSKSIMVWESSDLVHWSNSVCAVWLRKARVARGRPRRCMTTLAGNILFFGRRRFHPVITRTASIIARRRTSKHLARRRSGLSCGMEATV